jgi:uncharacterized membrane protein YidH (DUF202 family)
VSLGAGKLVPELTDASPWPYLAVGIGFAVLGIAFIAHGFWRQRQVEEAVRRGEYARLDERFMVAVTVIGVALSIALLVVMVVET